MCYATNTVLVQDTMNQSNPFSPSLIFLITTFTSGYVPYSILHESFYMQSIQSRHTTKDQLRKTGRLLYRNLDVVGQCNTMQASLIYDCKIAAACTPTWVLLYHPYWLQIPLIIIPSIITLTRIHVI